MPKTKNRLRHCLDAADGLRIFVEFFFSQALRTLVAFLKASHHLHAFSNITTTMRPTTLLAWASAFRAAFATLNTSNSAIDPLSISGLVEVDLLSPRQNETYAPGSLLPVVWAVRNANLASFFEGNLQSIFWTNGSSIGLYDHQDYKDYNMSGKDDVYIGTYAQFALEGEYTFVWTAVAKTCNSKFVGVESIKVPFHIKKGGINATNFYQPDRCSSMSSSVLNVTETHHNIVGGSEPENRCIIVPDDKAHRYPTGEPCSLRGNQTQLKNVTDSVIVAFKKNMCWKDPGLVNQAGFECPKESAADRAWLPASTAALLAGIITTSFLI